MYMTFRPTIACCVGNNFSHLLKWGRVWSHGIGILNSRLRKLYSTFFKWEEQIIWRMCLENFCLACYVVCLLLLVWESSRNREKVSCLHLSTNYQCPKVAPTTIFFYSSPKKSIWFFPWLSWTHIYFHQIFPLSFIDDFHTFLDRSPIFRQYTKFDLRMRRDGFVKNELLIKKLWLFVVATCYSKCRICTFHAVWGIWNQD